MTPFGNDCGDGKSKRYKELILLPEFGSLEATGKQDYCRIGKIPFARDRDWPGGNFALQVCRCHAGPLREIYLSLASREPWPVPHVRPGLDHLGTDHSLCSDTNTVRTSARPGPSSLINPG